MNNRKKAQVGDTIQSFNVTMPPDPTRGSYIGKVTRIECDGPFEWVYFDPLVELPGDAAEAQAISEHVGETFVIQNGIPSSLTGKVTDGIHIISSPWTEP